MAILGVRMIWIFSRNSFIVIFKIVLIDIFKIVLIDINIFQNGLNDIDSDIDIFKIVLIDIDILKKTNYISAINILYRRGLRWDEWKFGCILRKTFVPE